MKYNLLLCLLFLSCLLSCQSNKSIKKDFVTGLISQGDGISCDNVYLSNGNSKINRNSFLYGEKFYLNFENIIGFKKVKNNVFPGMDLLITSKKGDTIMHNPDLYQNNSDGFDIDPLLLQANITAASPIHSGGEYTFFVKIWDKKSNGAFKAEMDFDVQANDQIAINSNTISFGEIYLFSTETKSVIVENNIKFDETFYLVFEELKGFYEEEGQSFIGLSMLTKDADGNIIIEEKDLLADTNIATSELKELAPSFVFQQSIIRNPVSCEVLIWDKKSDAKIHALTKLNIN